MTMQMPNPTVTYTDSHYGELTGRLDTTFDTWALWVDVDDLPPAYPVIKDDSKYVVFAVTDKLAVERHDR